MWVTRVMGRSDAYVRRRTRTRTKTHLPKLQGRELQEAAAGAVSETGGICHAVGCRSLLEREPWVNGCSRSSGFGKNTAS